MKKTLFLILFALSITSLNAQKLEEPATFIKLNLKPIETVIDEQGREVDKETKALRVSYNEYFKSDVKPVFRNGTPTLPWCHFFAQLVLVDFAVHRNTISYSICCSLSMFRILDVVFFE